MVMKFIDIGKVYKNKKTGQMSILLPKKKLEKGLKDPFFIRVSLPKKVK